jgi:hypothetical protein
LETERRGPASRREINPPTIPNFIVNLAISKWEVEMSVLRLILLISVLALTVISDSSVPSKASLAWDSR